MTAEPKTDSQIIIDVRAAFANAKRKGCNWADELPDYIDCDEELAHDTDYVGSLADGRAIYSTPYGMDGYTIGWTR